MPSARHEIARTANGRLLLGIDVGSTTVKAALLREEGGDPLWLAYVRHEARQGDAVDDLLRQAHAIADGHPMHACLTGSGGEPTADSLRCPFIQEVNAVCLAVESRHPDVRGIVELGGQDSKIIVYGDDPERGARTRHASMNDKCAGGTGAFVEKAAAKLSLSLEAIAGMPYDPAATHPVAGKCGVFAETDINSLQKRGVPPGEIVASLFDAIVLQNLTVLSRSLTLRPRVILLGGPHYYLGGLRDCWRLHLERLWRERDVAYDAEAVFSPELGRFYGALGAIEALRPRLDQEPATGKLTPGGGTKIARKVTSSTPETGRPGLVHDAAEHAVFLEAYTQPAWTPQWRPGTATGAYLGLDGGSTSAKAVLLDEDGEVIAKAYELSQGNPVEDSRRVIASLRDQAREQGCAVTIHAAATTGYAKDMLKDAFQADLALVETVAHAHSGLHFCPGADVICDVGGQDIKVMVLKNGAVKDFRLNTQCSAGNGYYLQASAAALGVPLEDYADAAFSAERIPPFGYGCAVFLQSDIVGFQRQGWSPESILAGLAWTLPRNIWLYVCQTPNPSVLGSVFLLQGGTQRNLAAVKAQVRFIEERFAGLPESPRILVHPHCGESGAIGCALEARERHRSTGAHSRFIGLEAAAGIKYELLSDASTRCGYCANHCGRTLLTLHTPYGAERRMLLANCEKGALEDAAAVRAHQQSLRGVLEANPDLVAECASTAFAPPTDAPKAKFGGFRGAWSRHAREHLRVGMPRVLNLYGLAPFFTAIFMSLGVRSPYWSAPTTMTLYREGTTRGVIDPCFPSKVALAHVHDLLFRVHDDTPLTHIFFPVMDSLPAEIEETVASRTCPTSAATPMAVHAALVREGDLFAERGVTFRRTFLSLDDPELCARQMREDWPELRAGRREMREAVTAGFAALKNWRDGMKRRGAEVIAMLERENRPGIVFLSRPYHADPGINHGLCAEFQKMGYPVLPIEALPMDDATLARLYADEDGATPRSISDVWKNSFSENSSRKVMAAKYIARHPNLYAVEFSSFRCGHDSPIASTVEAIIEHAGKPLFYFRDMDENRAGGSIKIRIETIDYFLRRIRPRDGIGEHTP